MLFLCLAAFRRDFRIEVTIGAEASAERYVDVDHRLSEHEFSLSELALLSECLYGVDTLHI